MKTQSKIKSLSRNLLSVIFPVSEEISADLSTILTRFFESVKVSSFSRSPVRVRDYQIALNHEHQFEGGGACVPCFRYPEHWSSLWDRNEITQKLFPVFFEISKSFWLSKDEIKAAPVDKDRP